MALRADASASIGLGHVKRCLALAAALRAIGVDVKLVTRALGVETAAIATASNIESVELPTAVAERIGDDRVPHAEWAGVDWQVDADQCVEVLAHWHPDWVIVDHYAFDSRWHRDVSTKLGARVAVIDDLADRDISAKLLIDTNLSDDYRKKYRGRLSEDAVVLGGPRFALVGPSYLRAPRWVFQRMVHSIGIFMGGVDAGNLSCLALRACRQYAEFSGRVEIAATRAYPHLQALNRLANQWPETSIVNDLPDLAGFFARHDLQIGAGGTAAWERCCIGAPTLAFAAATNQDAVLPALAARGAVALTCAAGLPSEREIGGAVRLLLGDPETRSRLSERSRTLVDALGAKRVAIRLAAHWLTVRPATMGDSEMMYEWRNHPATRAVSLNTPAIRWPDHQQWLAASLKRESRHILVGTVCNADVGIVRFDSNGEEQSEVSLYLDPTMYGLSLGRSMLLAGESYILAVQPRTKQFTATVLGTNEASKRLFASCGYQLTHGHWQKSVTWHCGVR